MEDRPMNEYESAVFAGLMIVIRAIAHGKVETLAADFRESAKSDYNQGRKNAGATLEMLARIAEEDRYYVPSKPPYPFQVIKGGKDDPENSN